jgi:acyl-CoA synthetase (NDP forming)
VQKYRKPIFTFLSVPRETTAGAMDALEKAGIPILPSPSRVAKAMQVLSDYQSARRRIRAGTAEAVTPRPATRYAPGTMSEHEGKELLKAWNVPVTTDRLLPAAPLKAEEAAGINFPVALKIVSRDIAHKSEVGGVQLNIRNAEELAVEVRVMLSRVQQAVPAARLDGVLVSEMISDGIETIVGVINDSVFGPVVAFGLGGIFAETLKDVTYRLAPFGIETAREMISELRAAAILSGVRGKPAGDTGALAQTLVAVSQLAWQLRNTLEEMDINPLLVRPAGRGVVAADALLRFRA